ncbi:MAG: hypothetical protein LW721_15245 [Flammeovirgaceae bacterium]|jgi:hypothetical protein|nr:hypothetical protein [Flammeovirgaceae bacterium]
MIEVGETMTSRFKLDNTGAQARPKGGGVLAGARKPACPAGGHIWLLIFFPACR